MPIDEIIVIGQQKLENVMDPIVEIEIDGMIKSENIYEIEATEEIIILGKEKEKSGLNDI